MKRDTKGLSVRIQIKDEHGNVVGETDAVTLKGLLSIAHQEGLCSVETEIVALPTEANANTAVVRSTVETDKGTFTGIGDANPSNVDRRIAPHIIRMAETRATARALRLAVNIGEVSIEELGGDACVASHEGPAHQERASGNGREDAPSRSNGRRRHSHGRDNAPTEAHDGDSRHMSREQKKFLFRLAYEGGAERESALEVVLDALGVADLEQATRVGASQAIDELKRRIRGNGTSHPSEARHGA